MASNHQKYSINTASGSHNLQTGIYGPASALNQEYKRLFDDKAYVKSFALGLVSLVVALGIHVCAAMYATMQLGNPVNDLILGLFNAPSFTAWFFVYGTISFLFLVVVVCAAVPRSFPFVFKSAAVFTLIRAFFIILTHLGFPPGVVSVPNPTVFQSLFFRAGGLFFSGHAGLPFLFALIFWDSKTLRLLFLGCTAVLSFMVLLGHIHYSIDVFAGLFITHSIYYIDERLFVRDYRRLTGLPFQK